MGRVQVHNLGKRFKLYRRPLDRLLEWGTAGLRHRHVPLWVLRGIDFEVAVGEAVAVIGANGSGKSTLLKLIKGTLRPSEGFARAEGRVAALELGLGFHPDFTGRQNAFTAGALVGLGADRVAELAPGIEEFAEIGRYMDEPVRTYSSGMQLRLAFSVATAVRPDVLIVDEALAVGDAYFQQKCVARIRRFLDEGTTLLLVSHDPVAVRSLCDRALLLDEGLLVREGSPAEVLDYYNAMIAKHTADYGIRQQEPSAASGGWTRSGDGRAVIEQVDLRDDSGSQRAFRVGERLAIAVRGRAVSDLDDLTVGISIRDRLGNEVFGTNSHHLGLAGRKVAAGRHFCAEFGLPVNLGVGNYSLTAALHAGAVHPEGNYDWWDRVLVFQVLPGEEPPFVGSSYLPAEIEFRVSADDSERRGS